VQVHVTLGERAGPVVVTAKVGPLARTATVYADPGLARDLVLERGGTPLVGQLTLGSRDTVVLRVTARDAHGNRTALDAFAATATVRAAYRRDGSLPRARRGGGLAQRGADHGERVVDAVRGIRARRAVTAAAGRGEPGAGAGRRRVSPEELGRWADVLSHERVLVRRRRGRRRRVAQRDAGAAARAALDAGHEFRPRGDAVAARGGGKGGALTDGRLPPQSLHARRGRLRGHGGGDDVVTGLQLARGDRRDLRVGVVGDAEHDGDRRDRMVGLELPDHRAPGRRLPRPTAARHRRRRLEPQGGVRKPDDVLDRGDGDGHVRGHAGKQLQLRVREVDDRIVRDDVLHRRGVHADLTHDALEGVFGKRVDLERGALSQLDPADVRLVDLGVHPHLGQVLRDREDGRGLERRRDRLPHV